MRILFAIAKKELNRWLSMPSFYLCYGTLILGVGLYTWFFRKIFFNIDKIVPLAFHATYWGIAIFAPLLVVGSVLEEQKNGTAKMLFSKPVSIWHFVMGKFIAASFILLSFMLVPLLYCIGAEGLEDLHGFYVVIVPIFLVLVGLCYIIISLAVSVFAYTYLRSYLLSYLIIFCLHFVFAILGDISVGEVQQFFYYLGIKHHFGYFLSGGFALSTVVYLLSIVFLGILLTVFKLNRDNR